MTKQTTYYQLVIDVQIDADWRGTVFCSMLYTSPEACTDGCCGQELKEIVNTILRFSEFAAEECDVCDWLRGASEGYYDENDDKPLLWHIESYQTAK